MPNYRESSAQATVWRRCNRILIENPSSGTPRITLYEEDVASLGERAISKDAGVIVESFTPEEVFFTRTYPDGELTGDYVTQQHVFELLYSFYMHCANKRDNPTTTVAMGSQS